LAAHDGSPPVIVITAHGDVAMAVDAMKLGAYDFLEKPYEGAVLLERIAEALKSQATATGAGSSGAEAAALVAGLSQRQREVLQGILRGLQNKIIAFELGLSIRTVEAYRAQVLQRLGCRGTAAAVRLAIAAGLLDEPGASRSRGASQLTDA
jgi:two-component system response regulator FixJ